MSLLLYLSRLVNLGFSTCGRGRKFAEDVYRLVSEDGVWIINSLGVFVNSSQISTEGSGFWIYSDNIILQPGKQGALKGTPFLSCVFTIDDETYSMDEFLEETRCSPGVPFPVLMAAFTIHQKKLYNWVEADFNAYLRSGDEVKFKGSNPNF